MSVRPLRRLLLAVASLMALIAAPAFAATSLAPLTNISRAAVGERHGCAISNGGLWCWGDNQHGQLGDGSRNSAAQAIRIELPGTPTRVAVGERHTCAVVSGNAYCWGDNNQGQLGVGDLQSRLLPARTGIDLELVPRNGVVDVAAGQQHSCATDVNHFVHCWGRNDRGRTGQPALMRVEGDPTATAQSLPAIAGRLDAGVSGMGLGRSMSCAFGAEESLCWGANDVGQLGDGSTADRHVPAPVVDLDAPLNAIAIGEDEHVCAAMQGGAVRCWGNNYAGQVGLEPEASQPGTLIVTRPRSVPALETADTAALSLGFGYSCAGVGGDVRCWGQHPVDPASERRSATPQVVFQLRVDIEALTGRNGTVCSLTAARRLVCIGRAETVAQGEPITPLIAVPVEGLQHDQVRAGALSLGGAFGCQMGPNLRPRCWGSNEFGELGQGDREPREGAQTVDRRIHRMFSAGRRHTCGVDANMDHWCWGDNSQGALGTGDLIESAIPVHATLAWPTRDTVAGDGSSCSYEIYGGGAIACWGSNHRGQLGRAPSSEPVLQLERINLPSVITESVVAGYGHACTRILGEYGEPIWCWGRIVTSEAEQTDSASGSFTHVPREVELPVDREPAPGNARDVSPAPRGGLRGGLGASGATSCTGGYFGFLYCWGRDYSDAAALLRGEWRAPHRVELPVADDGSRYNARIAVGGRHLCAATEDGRVRCIGLPGRACAFERDVGRIMTPGQGISCTYSESELPEAQRGWLDVTGLPSLPVDQLEAGDEHACATMGRRTYCWGHNDKGQLGRPSRPVFAAPVEVRREGSLEPAARVPVVVSPGLACPGYYVSSVSLLEPDDARAAGAWGQELLLTGTSRRLHGGLNFGGFGTSESTPSVPGFGAFNIQSRDGRGQRIILTMRGNGGDFQLTIKSTVPPNPERRIVFAEQLQLDSEPVVRSLDLADGFHIISLQPHNGERLFLVSANTTTLEGGPASFFGGAVVGGYLSGERTGFAAICTTNSQDLSLRTESRGVRGSSGAGDLRLRLIDGQSQTVLYDSKVQP